MNADGTIGVGANAGSIVGDGVGSGTGGVTAVFVDASGCVSDWASPDVGRVNAADDACGRSMKGSENGDDSGSGGVSDDRDGSNVGVGKVPLSVDCEPKSSPNDDCSPDSCANITPTDGPYGPIPISSMNKILIYFDNL